MPEFPFRLLIKRASPKNAEESLLCTGLFRAVPGKRETYDALWNGTSVVAKVFSHRISARRHLKRELDGLNQLQRRGLSSARPLFFGRTEDGRWAVVLEKIADSATVLDVLAETTQKPRELDLLVRVCRELAKQHSEGVLQKDLHFGNFLLAGDRICALDPSQMQFFGRQVSRKKSISQLALLVLYLPTNDVQSARTICEEYFKARGWHFGPSDEALLQKQLSVQKERGVGHGLRKCLRTSKRCLQIRAGRNVAVFDKGFCRGAEPRDFIERIDTLMDEGQILKKGNTCYVSRLTWGGKDVVVKRYNHKGIFHSLRHTIKRSRARKAWLHAHRLGMLEISTPKPLAYIEHRKGPLVWKSYLVTHYTEGPSLYHFLRDEDVTQQQRTATTQQVKNLLDKLAKYRITHGDLKHTNVLITEDGPVLTDLDGMTVHRWGLLYRSKRAKDVARFLRQTSISPELADDSEKMRTDNWLIHIRRDFPRNEIGELISVSNSPVEGRDRFTRVPSSGYARVFRCNIAFNGISHRFYLKQYLRRSRLDSVKNLFRPSRARRARNASLMLHKNGFGVSEVVGLFERRRGPFCTESLLLTREVEDSKSMMQLLTDICEDSGDNALAGKRGLIRAFAETVGRMHAEGIFHGDLRLGNVLVAQEKRHWRFFFIDNERTRKFGRLPVRLRLKNLVQVNMFRHGIANTDRLRFFKAYIRMNPCVQIRYRAWARKIITKTNSRLRRKA